MRAVIVVFALLLSACAALSVPLPPAISQTDGLTVFATLSDSNSAVDMSASVVYTRLAMARHKAAVLLRQKKISVQKAVSVQEAADSIRQALEGSIAKRDLMTINLSANQADILLKSLQTNP